MAHAGGRPTKFKEEYIELAYNYTLLGATDKDLSNFFDVDEDTINRWKTDFPQFYESLKRGKSEADSVIASKLFHRAKGYDHPEIITASFQGQITDTMEVVKHYPPDTTAAIFWLKNRQPKLWRDKTETENVNLNHDMTAEEADKIIKKLGGTGD